MLISIFSARQITNPLEQLTVSSRAIAKGDFSQRVSLKSKTEIGELASTFNSMSQDLERFVFDLKRAAEENRSLFLSSIQMLAGAVDEKDPYTKGHSDRVTRFVIMDAPVPGVGPWEEILKNPLLWHFRFGGPDMDTLLVTSIAAGKPEGDE